MAMKEGLKCIRGSGNVFRDLGFDKGEAENLKMRSDLMIQIGMFYQRSALTEAQAAKRLGITRPRLRALLKGKIGQFSLDALVTIASRAGLNVQLLTRAAYRARPSSLAVPKRKLEALCQKYRIRKLSLFGSAARGEAGPDSDVDLMVEFEPDKVPSLWDFPEMQKAFSALFGGRRVDLVPPDALANPYRGKSIRRDLKVLYGGEERC